MDIAALFKAMEEVAQKYPDFAKQHLGPAAQTSWLNQARELADKDDPVGLGIAEIMKSHGLLDLK